jgi:HSP20 family molecular chaperone IbpA
MEENMTYSGDDFKLEDWERWMKDWLLDPYTTQLDETQFRVDLFDTTEAYIVEVTTEKFSVQEVILTKKNQTLTIEIIPKEKDRTKARSVNFPFSLKYHPIQLYPQKEYLEIHILKALDKQPAPSVIRFQGHI